MKKEHPYAQVLRWIADGEEIQCKSSIQGAYAMYDSESLLSFITSKQWLRPDWCRLKPRTIRIGEFDVPEPMREEPAYGALVHVVDLTYCPSGVFSMNWVSHSSNERYVQLGLCHGAKESAELHAKALMSFTTTESK